MEHSFDLSSPIYDYEDDPKLRSPDQELQKNLLLSAASESSSNSIVQSWDLDRFQERAVTAAIDKPLIIIAGPGSGKTTTICYRVACMAHIHRVPLESILVVTFTNRAAEDMKKRLGQVMLDIHNIHNNQKENSNHDDNNNNNNSCKFTTNKNDRKNSTGDVERDYNYIVDLTLTMTTFHAFCFKVLKERKWYVNNSNIHKSFSFAFGYQSL